MQLLGETDTVQSNTMITPWFLMHLISGIIASKILPNKLYGIVLHTIYEINDVYKGLRANCIKGEWSNNSVVNSIGDTIGFIIGQYIGETMKINLYRLIELYAILFFLFTHFKLG